ncbi:MAG: dipeptide epimerase [Planctomycetes bacterium]|nr:dipeptide epimerase [Planctomycetota bacterium]
MRITAVALRTESVPLSRPYAVANHATDTAAMVLLRLDTDGPYIGLGAATPEPEVNGDTHTEAAAQLGEVLEALRGREVAPPERFDDVLRRLRSPGARMALDIALHDLWARAAGQPLCELLGRVHRELPTSVTIGIGDVAATLTEAAEYLGRGFTVLKVKIGQDLELDVERLSRLRERVGRGITIRVDGNIGYRPPQLLALLRATTALDLELIEQPLPPELVAAQRLLPAALVDTLMADESLHDAADARELARAPRPFGLFNVKLVKCGGIAAARDIAAIAQQAGIGLMWGCMDDSRIAIAAALHAALACPATRYLDLDGHLDLSRDFATGGFVLERGVLSPLDRPGLGLEPLPAG